MSRVKGDTPVERRGAVGNGCCGNVSGDGRGGLADGDVIGGGCGVFIVCVEETTWRHL